MRAIPLEGQQSVGLLTVAQLCYIIPVRLGADPYRRINLFYLLNQLVGIPDLEIIIVEQDREPQLSGDSLPANCRLVFAFNPGPFNKGWSANVGFRHSTGQIIACGDADLLVPPSSLMACQTACLQRFDVMKPYERLIDLGKDVTHELVNGTVSVQEAAARGREGRGGERLPLCGGLFLIRRSVYEELGGFDERFVGWGGEDDALTSKVVRLGKRCGISDASPAYHLWHERPLHARFGHAHYQSNLDRAAWYATAARDQIESLCAEDRQSMGRLDKYA